MQSRTVRTRQMHENRFPASLGRSSARAANFPWLRLRISPIDPKEPLTRLNGRPETGRSMRALSNPRFEHSKADLGRMLPQARLTTPEQAEVGSVR